jgi:hypothetical protein
MCSVCWELVAGLDQWLAVFLEGGWEKRERERERHCLPGFVTWQSLSVFVEGRRAREREGVKENDKEASSLSLSMTLKRVGSAVRSSCLALQMSSNQLADMLGVIVIS